MAIMDPIADMLTRIRNANKAAHKTVMIPFSKFKLGIIKIMEENGFIVSFDIVDKENNKKEIIITLKYGENKEKVIYGLTRISKGGRRHYVSAENIPLVQGGLGIAILSTSKGIVTDKKAKQENIGGEVVCHMW